MAGPCAARRQIAQATAAKIPASAKKIGLGMPGTSAITTRAAATIAAGRQLRANSCDSRCAVVSVAPPRDSSSAAAIEVISAGIWLTRPSPMVR